MGLPRPSFLLMDMVGPTTEAIMIHGPGTSGLEVGVLADGMILGIGDLRGAGDHPGVGVLHGLGDHPGAGAPAGIAPHVPTERGAQGETVRLTPVPDGQAIIVLLQAVLLAQQLIPEAQANLHLALNGV